MQSKKKEGIEKNALDSKTATFEIDGISLENSEEQDVQYTGMHDVKKVKDEKESGEKTTQGFEERLLEVRKVTKVTTGGRRLGFRATILVGDRKGRIGLGVGKGADVMVAVRKATHEAYKNVVSVRITKDGSVLYPVVKKFKSCIVKILPAAPGTGLKAGSTVRAVLELAGYKNVLSKIVGTSNPLNNALVTLQILTSYKLKESHKTHVLEVDTSKIVNPHEEKKEKNAKKGNKKNQAKNQKKDRMQGKRSQKPKKALEKKEDVKKE